MQTNGFILKIYIYLLILEVGCRLKVFLCHQIMCTSHPWLCISRFLLARWFDLCHVCGCVHLLLGWPRFWVGKLMMCEQRGRQKESCSRVLFTRVFSKKTTQWLTWLSELLFVTTSSNLRWQPREISQLEIFIYDHSDDTWTHPQSTAGDLTFRPSLWRQWLSVYLHLVWTHT